MLWTGAGAAIDGMTAAGVRAAYCTDAEPPPDPRLDRRQRIGNRLRLTSETLLEEILDGC